MCAELHYTNSQIWFIRFDVDQSSKLVCVGNQSGEVFVWMLNGTEFVQVFYFSRWRDASAWLILAAGRQLLQQKVPRVCPPDGIGCDRWHCVIVVI